jgi:hypothetical protein
MAKTTEIAPDICRISIYAPWGDLQFNHFLIRDQEPLLFHSGLRGSRSTRGCLPHGWDAGVLFEETQKTLLCSDLFHQTGDVEPLTESDVVSRSHQAMLNYQGGILAEYVPYTCLTSKNLQKLAELKPKTLGIMHGSSFRGDCARALAELDQAFKQVFGRENATG